MIVSHVKELYNSEELLVNSLHYLGNLQYLECINIHCSNTFRVLGRGTMKSKPLLLLNLNNSISNNDRIDMKHSILFIERIYVVKHYLNYYVLIVFRIWTSITIFFMNSFIHWYRVYNLSARLRAK